MIDPEPIEGGAQPTSTTDELWRSALLQNAKTKAIKTTEANCSIILRCSEQWHDRIRYNLFTGQLEWRPRRADDWAEFCDHDAVSVQDALQRAEGVSFPLTVLHAAVEHAGRLTAYHPVREYLNGLQWDGEPRLRTWLSTYLGAVDEAGTAKIGRWWMISAVARAMRPGCKADHMIVLEGAQGVGKSTALSILGGDWYSETLSDLRHGKDAYMDLAGAWIVEIAELDAIRGAGATKIKSFISTSRDKYRPSYGRRSTYHPRQCVFAGTTNEAEYSEDATGARRIWPVTMTQLDMDGLTEVRDQLWAEARYYWACHEPWWPTREDAIQLAAMAEERRVRDPWEHLLAEWLDTKAAMDDSVKVADCLGRLEVPAHKQTKRDEMRVARILRARGWSRGRAGADRGRAWTFDTD